MGSFDNEGASMITYNLINITLPIEKNLTIRIIDYSTSIYNISSYSNQRFNRSSITFTVLFDSLNDFLHKKWDL